MKYDENEIIKIVERSTRTLVRSDKIIKKTLSELNDLKKYLIKYNAPSSLPTTLNDLKLEYEKFLNKFYKELDFDLFSKKRTIEYVYIRKCFFIMAKKHYICSFSSLARLCDTDHNVVRHAINKEIIDPLFNLIKEDLKRNNLYY